MSTWIYGGAFAAVLSAVALGCATPAPPEYDAYGYPVDYPIPRHDRYGVCSEHRHPNCHAHSRHYRDAHGDKKVYRWEHGHRRRGLPARAREQLTGVRSVSEERHSQTAADPPGKVTSDPVARAAGWVAVSRIIGIVDRGEKIQIIAKGPIDNFDSFVLEEPRRIVVDFWGAQSGVQAASRGFAEGPVARIRIREHPGRVRVVLDLRAEVPSHRIQLTATGVSILLDVSGDG